MDNDGEEFGSYEAAEHELKKRGFSFASSDPSGGRCFFTRERNYTHAGATVEDVAHVEWKSGGCGPRKGENVFVTVVTHGE